MSPTTFTFTEEQIVAMFAEIRLAGYRDALRTSVRDLNRAAVAQFSTAETSAEDGHAQGLRAAARLCEAADGAIDSNDVFRRLMDTVEGTIPDWAETFSVWEDQAKSIAAEAFPEVKP